VDNIDEESTLYCVYNGLALARRSVGGRNLVTIAVSSTVPLFNSPIPTDDKPLYEIIDGQRVELPPMSILATRVASLLIRKLGHFLEENPIGEALTEPLLHLPLPVDRNRRPDLVFVSAQRIAQAAPQPGSADAWDIVPELMVEVVSPNDLAEEIMEKMSEYWAAGTKLIWVVYPTQRLVYLYESPRQVRILAADEELDGGSVVPGFRIRIASLFPA
jgi:Uma2 family endonuclease